MTGSAREPRAFRVALMNGFLVCVVPLMVLLGGYFNAFGWSWPPGVTIYVVKFGLVFVTLAVIAGWRTWVHAMRFLTRQSSGWHGVAEAAACGFAVSILYLAPAVLALDPVAPRAVIAYGGLAAVVGCLVGVLLRVMAL